MKKREDLFDVFVSRDQVGRKVIVYVKDTTLRMTFGSTKLDIRSAGSRIRLDSVQLESYTSEQRIGYPWIVFALLRHMRMEGRSAIT